MLDLDCAVVAIHHLGIGVPFPGTVPGIAFYSNDCVQKSIRIGHKYEGLYYINGKDANLGEVITALETLKPVKMDQLDEFTVERLLKMQEIDHFSILDPFYNMMKDKIEQVKGERIKKFLLSMFHLLDCDSTSIERINSKISTLEKEIENLKRDALLIKYKLMLSS